MNAQRQVDVSVVVPTKNRPHEVARMLDSLRSQPTQPREVIVVDQSTPAYDLAPFAGLRHEHDPALSGLTAARNRGVDLAQGSVVLFFDDDAVLQADCVGIVDELFGRRPDVVGVQCNVYYPESEAPLSLWDVSVAIFEHGFFNSRPRRRGADREPRLIDGVASAYRRTLFAEERFDETLVGYCLAEDWDFTKRAQRHGRLVIAEDARVLHEPSPTNRHDVQRYVEQRWKNILYLYDKLEAGRDPRNRFWRQWWMLGEQLRLLKIGWLPRIPH